MCARSSISSMSPRGLSSLPWIAQSWHGAAVPTAERFLGSSRGVPLPVRQDHGLVVDLLVILRRLRRPSVYCITDRCLLVLHEVGHGPSSRPLEAQLHELVLAACVSSFAAIWRAYIIRSSWNLVLQSEMRKMRKTYVPLGDRPCEISTRCASVIVWVDLARASRDRFLGRFNLVLPTAIR